MKKAPQKTLLLLIDPSLYVELPLSKILAPNAGPLIDRKSVV